MEIMIFREGCIFTFKMSVLEIKSHDQNVSTLFSLNI